MLSAFAPNVQFLIFSYGIVVGEYASAASEHRLILFSCFVFPPVTQRGNTSGQILHVQTLLSFHYRINRNLGLEAETVTGLCWMKLEGERPATSRPRRLAAMEAARAAAMHISRHAFIFKVGVHAGCDRTCTCTCSSFRLP